MNLFEQDLVHTTNPPFIITIASSLSYSIDQDFQFQSNKREKSLVLAFLGIYFMVNY
jgi:hypothetical protein